MSSSPSSAAPPPTSSNNGTDSCGGKFRKMLACVERTSDVSACTFAINSFLACERAVFQSALRATPPPPSSSYPKQEASAALPPPPRPPQPEHPSSLPPAAPPTDDWRVFNLDLVKRALSKQAHACSRMVQTVAHTDTPARIVNYSQRIVKDISYSVSLLSKKVVDYARSFGGSDRDDD